MEFGKCYTVFVVRSFLGLYGTSGIKYNRLYNNDEISRAHVLILKNGRMTPDIPAGYQVSGAICDRVLLGMMMMMMS